MNPFDAFTDLLWAGAIGIAAVAMTIDATLMMLDWLRRRRPAPLSTEQE